MDTFGTFQVSTTERLSLFLNSAMEHGSLNVYSTMSKAIKFPTLLSTFRPLFYFHTQETTKIEKKSTMRKVVCNRTLFNRF